MRQKGYEPAAECDSILEVSVDTGRLPIGCVVGSWQVQVVDVHGYSV